jgi:nucleoid DNA-binding protein
MIKTELVQRIAMQNPHLYQRDVENIVNSILNMITAALRGEIGSNCAGSGPFRSRSAQPALGAIRALARKFRCGRSASPSSRPARRCVSA